MTTFFALAGMFMLATAAALVLYRVYRGPTNLDRLVATDILLVIVIAGVGMEAAWHKRTTSLPLLMVLGIVSFVGGVAIARFMSHDSDREAP
jgi:multicomponent Na+:H+ antiporter subunit F